MPLEDKKEEEEEERRPEHGGRRRRKRPVEEWRTFRYRSPPHNRTSVTEGAIPDHLVSLHRGRPGHLAVTSAIRPSPSFFSLLSTNPLCLSFFLSLSFFLLLTSRANRLRAVIVRRASRAMCTATRHIKER